MMPKHDRIQGQLSQLSPRGVARGSLTFVNIRGQM
jgi:hypothetical protein